MLKELQRRLAHLQRLWRTKEQVVQAWFDAVERGDLAAAAELLDEGFLCRGWTPRPLRRQAFLDLHRRLRQAFPDLAYHARHFRVSGDAVRVTISVTGTQTGELQLPEVTAVHVAPTGKSVSLPEEYPVFIVRHGRITEVHEVTPPGAGVSGILRQLGGLQPSVQPDLAEPARERVAGLSLAATTSWQSFVLHAVSAH